MRGFEKQYISKIKENVKPSNAILELIDNSIDAGASRVEITYRGGKLTIVDNGKGMSTSTLKKWCSEVEAHCVSKSEKNKIGLRGVGSKAALIALSNLTDNSSCMTKIISKTKNDVGYIVFWNIAREGQQTTDTSRYPDKNECGTEIIICDCVELNLSTIKKMISATYSRFSKKVEIIVNNEKISCVDKCYLDVLGNDINKDGIYFKEGIAFIVNTFNATHEKTLEHITLKAVALYVTKEGVLLHNESARNYADYGLFTLFNNRYINYGDNVKEMFGKGNSQRGGLNGARIVLFADNNNANILKIESDKSNGILPLIENLPLKKFYLDNVEKKESIFDAITTLFFKTRTLNDFQSKGSKESGSHNEITKDVVINIVNNKCVKVVKKRYIDITCADDLNSIIPEFKTEASPKIKSICYTLHNMLSSGAYGKLSRKQIDNFVKDFWNKEYGKNVQYHKVG